MSPFEQDQFVTYAGFFVLILSSYFLIFLINDFFYKYVNVVFYLSAISIPLFILQLLIPKTLFFLNDLISKISPSLFKVGGPTYSNSLIFTFYQSHVARNCGFSWEPGAFGFILTLTLMIHLTIKPNNKIDKKLIVLIIAILTTISTTAYIGLIIGLTYYYINLGKIKLLFVYGLIIIPSFVFIINLPFMAEKIENTYDVESNEQIIDRSISYQHAMGEIYSPNRFASMIIDLRDFVNDPIIGKGLNEKTRFSNITYNINFANGLSNLLVKYGIIGFVLYFYLLSMSFRKLVKNYNKQYFFIIILGVLLVGFSEPLLESLSLFSMQYYIFKKEDK